MKIAVVGFTSKGCKLASHITEIFEGATVVSNKKEFINKHFNDFDAWVFVSATGIAVRYIAGLLQNKTVDPAVIVIDEKGDFVIPILSGHIGGANDLAHELADRLNGTAVITTATDINNVLSIDCYAVKNNLKIVNPQNIKMVSSRLLDDKKVGFFSDIENCKIIPGLENNMDLPVGVCVSYNADLNPFECTLNLVPQDIVIGVGCRRNTPKDKMLEWINSELYNRGISSLAISKIVSIDLKKDEEAIIELAKTFGVEFETFSSEELLSVEGEFTSSDFVSSVTGVDNVCERAAVFNGEKLIVKKIKGEGMTLAISTKNGNEVVL